MIFTPETCAEHGCPEPDLCARVGPQLGFHIHHRIHWLWYNSPVHREQWERRAEGRKAPDVAEGRKAPDVAEGRKVPDVAEGRKAPDSRPAVANPGPHGPRLANLASVKAELARGQCRYLGDRLPNQPCGQALHHCNYDGITCSRMTPCKDAQRVCAACTYHAPATIFEQGATGMGDVLLGLLAVAGYKREYPDQVVHYRVSNGGRQWASLFGGYDHLSGGAKEHNEHAVAGAKQINIGYDQELRTRFAEPRVRRYCRNIGASYPVIPSLREPERIRSLGAQYAGAVILAPFISKPDWRIREYSLTGWLELEALLIGGGYRTLILHGSAPRTERFRGEKVIGQSAEQVAGVVLNSSCVISNDSGLAHLGGILGRPTVVLCGPTPGPAVFGAYGAHVRCLEGGYACSGCSWQPPYSAECGDRCPSLLAITSTQILNTVAGIVRPIPPIDFPAADLRRLFAAQDLHQNLDEWTRQYEALFRVVREISPRTIVEIGVRAGYSSWTMLRASPRARLLGVDANFDPNLNNSHGGYLDAWRHAERINAGGRWQLLLADSHALQRLPQIDLVYIDGDHSLEGCTQDLELADRSSARWILLDDYNTLESEGFRVRTAVDRFMAAAGSRFRGRLVDNGSTGLYVMERLFFSR